MSDEPKSDSSQKTEGEQPPQKRSTVPVWIFSLTIVLIYLGAVYFDHHGGWFDAQVYAPYADAEELDSYQPKSGAAQFLAQGKKSYEITCGICHGTDGLGKPGQFPPLAGSEWVNAKDFKRLAHIPLEGLNGVVHVKGQEWNSTMPAMGAGLSNSDLAAVLTYIRSSWGNNAGALTADDVKVVRATAAGKPAINGEAQLKTIPE
ncbi:MAG: c-type cytochrome [Limisphaerales bacterium]